MTRHVLTVLPDGRLQAVYDDELVALLSEGEAEIKRASHVEPYPYMGGWNADMRPSGGPVLGPFALRADALAAERAWLEANL